MLPPTASAACCRLYSPLCLFLTSFTFLLSLPPTPQPYFLLSRFSIDPQSDPEALFRISPDAGLITTAMELDREREHWHNITAIATQRGQSLAPIRTARYCPAAGLAEILQRVRCHRHPPMSRRVSEVPAGQKRRTRLPKPRAKRDAVDLRLVGNSWSILIVQKCRFVAANERRFFFLLLLLPGAFFFLFVSNPRLFILCWVAKSECAHAGFIRVSLINRYLQA